MLRAGAVNTFSPNSPTTVASGGALDLNGFNQTFLSVTNAGLVNMGTGTAPGTLLTTTNYIGTGGTIAMNTVLAGDGSSSDRLVINGGTASGNSSLRITNAGGAGALTTGNGILVVDAINGGTTAAGAFVLAGPSVAGPYEYALFRSSLDPTNSQAWYLRSTLNCTLSPALSECQPPVTSTPIPPTPSTPTTPNFRVETSLYAVIPSMALLYGRNLLDSRHERVGEEFDEGLVRNAYASAYDKASPFNPASQYLGWGRVIGANGVQHGDSLGVLGGTGGPHFDYSFLGLQAGMDLYRNDRPDGRRDHAGAYSRSAEIGAGQPLRQQEGDSDFAAYSLGGYWTHFGPPAGTPTRSSRARSTTSTARPTAACRIQDRWPGNRRLNRGRISVQVRRRIFHRTAGATGVAEHQYQRHQRHCRTNPLLGCQLTRRADRRSVWPDMGD